MARKLPSARGGRAARGMHGARRAWPIVMMAWERWQSLTPEEKERYKARARQYAERSRGVMEKRRGKRR